MQAKPLVLCILDGWGFSAEKVGNAPYLAKTPAIDHIMRNYPNSKLVTHGKDVGLPVDQMGNSEVGHFNIGAGRILQMALNQIDLSIESGAYAQNRALNSFSSQVKASGGTAHLMSLLSDGGVHGHLSHLVATLEILYREQVPTAVHLIADGRDVAPSSITGYLAKFCKDLPPTAFIATLTGRYYALDRDNRWDRVKKAYYAMILGQAEKRFSTAEAAIEEGYRKCLSDEFLPACTIADYEGSKDGDAFFCLNLRADRARQICSAVADNNFQEFEIPHRREWSAVLGMVPYSEKHNRYMDICFPKKEIKNTLGEWIARQGKTQFRLAETEKYPHVTFFFNGGQETPHAGEDRWMPASPKVATYDLQPEMSSEEVTTALIKAIYKRFDLIVVNYANPDMIGHTGNLEAAILACEAVDKCVGKALDALKAVGGVMLLTADHGNCETMVDLTTSMPHTAHTINLVPIALVNGPCDVGLKEGGRLADIAPTVLSIMGLPSPPEMTGRSLLY